MFPFGEVMYGTVELENSDSQLRVAGHVGVGLLQVGPDVLEQALRQRTRRDRAVLLPDQVGRAAAGGLALHGRVGRVMLAVLFGSHCTVTFLCAASYWVVSFFSPALSDELIGPVFGGRTALIVTWPPLEPLDEPLDEHAAASPAASSRAAAAERGVLMGMLRTVPTS